MAIFISLVLPRVTFATPEVRHGWMPPDNELIEFYSSDSNFDSKLNNFYHDMLKGKVNSSLETTQDSYTNNRIFDPSWSLWREWQAMSTAYLINDNIRNANKVFLQDIKVDARGFVYNGYSEEEIGWIFPNYQDSYGKSTGWEFNTPGNLEDWIPERFDNAEVKQITNDRIGLLTTTSQNDPKLRKENLSIDSFNCPIFRINTASQHDDPHLVLYWKSDIEPNWSEDKKFEITLNNDGSWNTYNLLVYQNAKWRGTITGLSLDITPKGGATRPGYGPFAGVDYIRCAYDSRHSIDNTSYILGTWQYYMWTKDDAFLQSMLPKLRNVINFLGIEFQGDSLGYLQNPWWGHEGTSGIDILTNPFTRIPGRGMGSNWQDGLPFGGSDGYLTSYYYRALLAMTDLDPGNRQTYSTKASLVIQASDGKFWNSATGRFTPVIDANNQSHDYGYTFANLEMLFNGFGGANKADSIFNWLDGNPDIYKPVFAPRLNTENNNKWYMWQMVEGDTGKNPPGILPQWSRQIQNGGAALYYSFYDVIDRIIYKGADNAFDRFKTIVDWWDNVKTAGGVRNYYENGAGKSILNSFWRLQGCGTDGGIGLDCEFPENVIVPTAFLYGFLGIIPQTDGLHINPHLPSSLSYAGVDNIYHWRSVYNIKADKNIREVSITNNGGIYQVNVPADKETIIANGSCLQCLSPSPTPIPPTPTVTSVTPTISPTPIPGDITGKDGVPDGVVNIYDYNKLIGDFGKTGAPGFTPSDIDKNGKVDIYDYNTLVGNFGKTQ